MALYTITPEVAQKAARDFEEIAPIIKQIMNGGYDKCQGVLSKYQGEQKKAFWDVLSQIGTEMNGISQALDTQGSLVNSAQSTYASTDQQVTADYRGAIRGVLG